MLQIFTCAQHRTRADAQLRIYQWVWLFLDYFYILICKNPVGSQSWGAKAKLSAAGGGSPGAGATPVPGPAVRDLPAHTRMPKGLFTLDSAALIRKQDSGRYLLTSCLLGAGPNKAANKPATKAQPLAEFGPQERN